RRQDSYLFFRAEDGIRDVHVTGVQTCALPILAAGNAPRKIKPTGILPVVPKTTIEQGLEASLELALSQWQYHEELWVRGEAAAKIGRASCRERVGLMIEETAGTQKRIRVTEDR